MKLPLVRPLLALALAATTSACAANGAAGGRAGNANSSTITRAEMDATPARDVYDLVQRLRPRWLVSRGSRSLNLETQVLVFLNSNRLGGVESLRQLETTGITSLEYMDAVTATSMLSGIGSDHVSGAIIVHTGAPRPR